MIEYVRVNKPILVVGYDWERYGKENLSNSEKKRQQEMGILGLKILCNVHKKLDQPFSLFILGKMLVNPKILETILNELKSEKLKKLIDIEQHAYSHVEFKKLPGRIPLELHDIKWEVSYTKQLIQKKIGVNSNGIRLPQGHYKGLQGNDEILNELYYEDIKFISSDLRNENEQFPSSWYDDIGHFRQPYFYNKNKFKGLLEIPTIGWNDNALKGMSRDKIVKKHSLEEELLIYKNNIDFAILNELCYTPLFHPWATAMTDKNGYVWIEVLKYANQRGMEIMSYIDLYNYIVDKKTVQKKW